jgi:hypothetical protein
MSDASRLSLAFLCVLCARPISHAWPNIECGGLPPLSSKLYGRQQNDLGEARLAHLGLSLRPLGFCGKLRRLSAVPSVLC